MRFNICAMDDLTCYAEGKALRHRSDDFDEDDGEDVNKDINLSASVRVTIQEMNRNFNQMGNSASYNCEQPLQIQEPGNLTESSKSTEEEWLNDLSQSSKRIIEFRRRDSTSLSPSSCTEDVGMKQVSQNSTPRSTDNEARTDGLLLSPEVIVINLCTPSSGIIQSKTKRALFDAAIIDLTDSPMVIQV